MFRPISLSLICNNRRSLGSHRLRRHTVSHSHLGRRRQLRLSRLERISDILMERSLDQIFSTLQQLSLSPAATDKQPYKSK